MIVNVNHCPHYVEIYGTGDPIIFLHGLYMDHTIWVQQVIKFAKTNQVILYDQRGHGRTEKGEQNVTFNQLADDLNELVHKLEVSSPTLIGYSTAGAIVLNTLTRYPNLAKNAVVTGAFVDMKGLYIYINQRIGLFSTKKRLKRITAFFLALNHATSLRQFVSFVKSVMRCDQTAVQELLNDMKQFDISNALKEVRCPVLLLYGSKEHLYYRKEMLDIVKYLPHVQIHFIKGVRHGTMTKTADQFYEHTKNFLNTTSDST